MRQADGIEIAAKENLREGQVPAAGPGGAKRRRSGPKVRQPAETAGGLRPALTLHNIQKQQRTASNRDTARRKGALVSRL